MTGEELGRLTDDDVASHITLDIAAKGVKAILTKQDQIITKLNLILAAIETATDGNTLFTALDTAAIKAELTKLKFTL